MGARWNRSRWVEAVLADTCSVCLGLEIGGLGTPLQTPVPSFWIRKWVLRGYTIHGQVFFN